MSSLLAEYAVRVPRSEEFLKMMEDAEAKRDKQNILQSIETRLISKERKKYRTEAF